MPKCPNCGQPTARTGDWACPWCGYPLLSKAYRKIPKTYKQLKEERLQKQTLSSGGETGALAEPEAEPAVDTETETEVVMETEPVLVADTEPESEAIAEIEPEGEAATEAEVEAEAVAEPEPAPKPRARRVAKAKAKAKPAPKPKAKPKAKAEPETLSEPETASKPETTPAAIEITVEELLSAYATEGVATDAKFVNKILEVTGVVDRIEIKEDLDIQYINLTNAAQNLLQSIRCIFDKKHVPKLNSLTTGQAVTVQGTYDGSIMDIRMKDCVLVH